MTTPAPAVSTRELNRWLLARHHLLERAPLGVEDGLDAIAGMQAQNPQSPYVGLWSRLEGFRREDLERAALEDRVVKATLMRGTLHLVTMRNLARYRAATSSGELGRGFRALVAAGVDVVEVREEVVRRVRRRPLSRTEIGRVILERVPDPADWMVEYPAALATVSVATDLVHVPQDALFTRTASSGYRVSPVPPETDDRSALRHVAESYLRAFGPASRADLSSWSGNKVSAFAPVLDEMELVYFRHDGAGPLLMDLPDASRPSADVPAPVRFLGWWDNLFIGHARRQRIVPDELKRTMIAMNGDLRPSFLVDGFPAGTWSLPLRGDAVLTLAPFARLQRAARREVEEEAHRLAAWYRPDGDDVAVVWAPS